MRRDKVASRILLILSVVHVAAAAPATIRQRYLEITKNVTPALEKRANLDDDSSHHFPRMDNNLPSTSGTLPSQDDTSPAPGDPQLHSDSPPELGTPQLHIDHPPTSGTLQLQDDDLPPTPGAPPSQHDPLLASGTPFLHNDQPSTSGPSPSQDDTLPGSGTLQPQDETSPASGDPQLHSGPPPELETSQLHIDHPLTPGALSLEDDMLTSGVPPRGDDLLWPGGWVDFSASILRGESSNAYEEPLREMPSGWLPGGTLFHWSPGGRFYWGSPGTWSKTSKAPQLQNDPPPASGTPQLHHDGSYRWANDLPGTELRPSSPDFDSDIPPPLHLETPPPLHLETPPPLHLDPEIPPPLDSETPQPLESEALPSAPETHTFFNDALKQKLTVVAGVGAVAGVSVGLGLGVDKLIKDHSHKSHPAGRDLASSGVVGRGANMHPRPRKNPISRAPAKLRDEDLRLLSVLTRRALERLD